MGLPFLLQSQCSIFRAGLIDSTDTGAWDGLLGWVLEMRRIGLALLLASDGLTVLIHRLRQLHLTSPNPPPGRCC
jgi:hypothetical protein